MFQRANQLRERLPLSVSWAAIDVSQRTVCGHISRLFRAHSPVSAMPPKKAAVAADAVAVEDQPGSEPEEAEVADDQSVSEEEPEPEPRKKVYKKKPQPKPAEVSSGAEGFISR